LTSECRSTSLLKTKISEPVLLVHAVKSLDDAIDFINSDSSELLAAYHFGENAQCKYLSQFVASQVSYVNHIPAELLGQYSTLELTINTQNQD
jgi:acyl-CoA reductase-like NAD-dependent aldehyde dehydrogenase